MVLGTLRKCGIDYMIRANGVNVRKRISIIMPVYNTGNYLIESLESLRGQTFADFEIICVDDASSDPKTIQILNEYQEKESRLYVIKL